MSEGSDGAYRAATGVTRTGEGIWSAELAPDWDILGNTNGGYLLAIASRASSEAVDGRDPVTITGHYTRPAHTGPVRLETEVVRSGRRLAVVRSRMYQDERVVLETLGTFQTRQEEVETTLTDAAPPDLPAPDDCPRMLPADDAPFPPPSVGRIDLRAGPEIAQLFLEGKTSSPVVTGWFRLLDGEPLDAHALMVGSDAYPPTAFVAGLPVGWTPTIELTVHIREPEPKGWIRCDITSRFVSGGFIEEDGLFWDEEDRLVAQSRQLAMVSRG